MQNREVTYSFLIDIIFYIRVNRLMTCEQIGKKMKNTGLMSIQALCVRTRSCGDVQQAYPLHKGQILLKSSTLLLWGYVGQVLSTFQYFFKQAKFKCFVKSPNFNYQLNILKYFSFYTYLSFLFFSFHELIQEVSIFIQLLSTKHCDGTGEKYRSEN